MTIRRATTEDVPEVAALLAEAFHADLVSIWLFPDNERRREIQRPFFHAFATLALAAGGSISLREDGLAATIWFPSGDDDGDDFMSHFGFLADEEAKRLGHLADLMAENHPDRGEHWHLQFIGVHPDHQRHGIGGELLAHDLAALGDRPAYLEASSHRSVPLYRRHGFEPIGRPFDPGPRARMFPMWRTP